MAARTHAARLLSIRPRERTTRASDDRMLAAMAKLSPPRPRRKRSTPPSSSTARSRLERGHPLEHLYREVRAPRIYEGASEIQREIIARRLFASGR